MENTEINFHGIILKGETIFNEEANKQSFSLVEIELLDPEGFISDEKTALMACDVASLKIMASYNHSTFKSNRAKPVRIKSEKRKCAIRQLLTMTAKPGSSFIRVDFAINSPRFNLATKEKEDGTDDSESDSIS